MSTQVLPALPMLGWPATKEPVFVTRRQESISGKETVIADQSIPRYLFTLTMDRLRQGTINGTNYAEQALLQGFFEGRLAGADSFLYQDPDDNAVTNQQIGVGNWENGVSPNGTIDFFTGAPAVGAAIVASFSYYFPCRFTDDSMSFDKIMDKRWAVKKIQFKSIK